MRFTVVLRRIALLSASLLGLGMCLLVAILFQLGPFGHDEMYVPQYPGATNVQVLAQKDLKDVDWFNDDPYKVVTFTTTDKPDQVFTFFKNDLVNRPFEDWRPYMVEQDTAHFKIIGFGPGPIGAISGGPMYTFVATTEQREGLTHVRVERYFFPGM